MNIDYEELLNTSVDNELILENEVDMIRNNLQATVLLYGIDGNFEEVKLTLEGVK